jgi:beta-lactamase regulating signal transducer with metallopeptidase domain
MMGLSFFDTPSWRFLVLALLHSLWQGTLISLLLAFVLRRLQASRHDARYALALAAQCSVLVTGLATWAWLDRTEAEASPVAVHPSTPAMSEGTSEFVIVSKATTTQEGRSIPPLAESSWAPVLAIGWLTGVVLMLLRSAGAVFSASRLGRGSRVTEPAIVSLLDRLREELRIRRPIRVVACETISGPAVLGLIRPTLLLPISLISGLPPVAVRAILAHELAHIRRLDYAVNLLQMLIESLLFFNPMVWWLGRQVRIEREACCDAMAVRVVGSPLSYSHALAEWAGAIGAPLGVAAWNGDGRPSTLLERIRRVLRPGERFGPQRLSLAGLIVLLLVGPMLLVALWKGTQTAVVLAAQALTPAQRIERIEEAKANYGLQPNRKGAKTVLKGTIRTSDGKPPASKSLLSVITINSGGTVMKSAGEFQDSFSVESSNGSVWVLADPDGYAPKLIGPFKAEGGEVIDDLAIVLDPGFPYRIRLIDEQGQPVAGAMVGGGLLCDRGWTSSRPGWTTDADGVATIVHAAPQTYGLSISASGFQVPKTEFRATPNPGGVTTFTLKRAQETLGVVEDRDGRPVPEATIRIMVEFQPDQGSHHHGTIGPVVGMTDSNGRFRINTLRDGVSYLLFVESKAQERGFIPNVRSGQANLRAKLAPCPNLEGRVLGDLKLLEHNHGAPVLWSTQDVPTGILEGGPATTRLNRRASVDSNGGFKLEDLVPGELSIRAGKQESKFTIPDAAGPLIVDLNQPSRGPADRRVALRLISTEGAIRSQGALRIVDQLADSITDRKVELRDGYTEFDAPVGGRVSYQVESMAGYWFPSGDLTVEPGEGKQIVEIKTVPAGAITGRVLNLDGSPTVEGVSLSCKALEKPPSLRDQSLHVDNVRVDADGRFFVSPLPLGGVYVVVATRGRAPQASDSIRLDEAKPTDQVEIRLPRTTLATGRVLDPDGRPLRDAPVSLVLEDPLVGTSWNPPILTDKDGRFRFDDLAADRDGYVVRLKFRKDYQPVRATLQSGGAPIEIQVERGRRLEGQVVEASTGRPIPGVEMFAMTYTPGDPKSVRRFDPESVTDEEGRFRFSNLPDGTIQLNDGSGLKWESPTSREVRSDSSPPIVVRATLPSWSQLKPSPKK